MSTLSTSQDQFQGKLLNKWITYGQAQNRLLLGTSNSVGLKGHSINIERRESMREINIKNREFTTAASTGITGRSFNKLNQISAMNKTHHKSRQSNSTPSIINLIFTSCTLCSEAVFLSHKCHVTDHYISTLCSREREKLIFLFPLLKACPKYRTSNTIHQIFCHFIFSLFQNIGCFYGSLFPPLNKI